MVNYLLQLDRSILIMINMDWTNSIFNLIMPWITRLANPSVVWIWIVTIGLIEVKQFAIPVKTTLSNRLKYKLFMQAGLYFCLFLALIYGINAGMYIGLKHLVSRPRPFEQQNVMLRVNASDLSSKGSFPSGHASNAFMVAAFFGACIKKNALLFMALQVWFH